MYIACGLGQQQVRDGSFTVPSAPSPSYEAEKKLSVRLEDTAIFSGWHPTLPVHRANAIEKIFLLNGYDRTKKYGLKGARTAFTAAPVRPPTLTRHALATPSDLGQPVGVVVVGDYLYVADHSNDRVVKLRLSDFKLVAEITEASSGSDLLEEPKALCSDGTYLYVTTAEGVSKHRVVKYNLSDLSYAGAIGSYGSGSSQFNNPNGICTDGTYLYISDGGNDRIVKVQISDMSWQSTYGSSGSGSGQFDQPVGIACDSDNGHLWICDSLNNRIVITDYLAGGGTTFTGYDATAAGETFSFPTGITLDGTFAYILDTTNFRLVALEMNGLSTPAWGRSKGDIGLGTDQYQTSGRIFYDGFYLYVTQGSASNADAASVRKVLAANLTETARGSASLEAYSVGRRGYAYSYVDDDGHETDYCEIAEEDHGVSIDCDIAGFHSMDSKVAKIRVYASHLDYPQELYLHSEITNNPAGTTWSMTDTKADSELTEYPPLTEKRAGVHGLPPACRVGTVWRDRLVMGGRIPVPDYSVGQATFAATWDSDHGLWKVTGTGTHWHERMVGMVIVMASDDSKYGTIVHVEDETTLYLCTEWEGTTGSAIDYQIEDWREDSYLFFSVPGLYEDIPASYYLPCDVGDGDDIVALYPKGELLFVFKRNSVGVVTGTTPENMVYRRLTKSCGVQSPSSVIEFSVPGSGPVLAFWSYPTIYAISSQNSEPMPFSTFIDPLLAESEVDAAARCVALRDPENRLTWFSLGTDTDVANSDTYLFEDYGKSWSREPGPRMSAAGGFRDRNGRRVPLYMDEFGVLWQPGIGDSEGAYANDLVGAVESYDGQTLRVTNNSLTFSDDLVGVPVFLVDENGTYSRNIIVGSGTHYFELAWEPSSVPDSDFSFIIGGIEYLFETGQITAGVPENRQKFEQLWIEHEETAATVLLSVAADEENFQSLLELDFSGSSPEAVGLSGSRWSFDGSAIRFRLSSLSPGESWRLRGYSFEISYREEIIGR